VTIEIRVSDWPPAREEAQRVRFTVFVDEQRVPAELEMDEHDAVSIHALAYTKIGGTPRAVGTGRLLPDGHIGRMAVLKEWRGRGVGRELLRALMQRARERGDREVVLAAQVQAMPFYAAEGFKPEGPVYVEAGIDHQDMRCRLG
jgi:predicted GNAT family N-acyltransferase